MQGGQSRTAAAQQCVISFEHPAREGRLASDESAAFKRRNRGIDNRWIDQKDASVPVCLGLRMVAARLRCLYKAKCQS